MSSPVVISIVVPVFDEEQSLPELHAEIVRHVGGMGLPWEVIYVDDRSRDRSLAVLLELRRACPQVRVVRFRRNFGQTAALAAGFDSSRGEVVVTMDADLQNDPADIPRMVEELHRGYDLVAGWRRERRDGLLLRRLPSIAANRLISWVTGTPIHDTGCTLKVFRRELVANMPIYAEQHRFLPVLAGASGARIGEVVVHHRARRYGASKYGLGRATRVALDLLTVKMLGSSSRAPLRYFAALASPFALAAVVFAVVGIANTTGESASGEGATLALVLFPTATAVLACAYFLSLGLLAELAVKASDLHGRESLSPLTSRGDDAR